VGQHLLGGDQPVLALAQIQPVAARDVGQPLVPERQIDLVQNGVQALAEQAPQAVVAQGLVHEHLHGLVPVTQALGHKPDGIRVHVVQAGHVLGGVLAQGSAGHSGVCASSLLCPDPPGNLLGWVAAVE